MLAGAEPDEVDGEADAGLVLTLPLASAGDFQAFFGVDGTNGLISTTLVSWLAESSGDDDEDKDRFMMLRIRRYTAITSAR